jgi:methylated-DNA-[protein]-cysteine S-methyltransferase
MTFVCKYETPNGFSDMVMTSDGKVLTGLHFVESRKVAHTRRNCAECDLPIFRETRRWLDCYFSGRQPDFTPPYRIDGLTPFRKDVTDAMLAIPFGQTTTYGSIAEGIARKHGLAKMSAQAVGGAVGWNPICIIIPCHRVVGANGALVGYGGGIGNKIALLNLEKRYAMEG